MRKKQIPLFNRALRYLLVTNACILMAGAMLGPIYALFVEEIGGDVLDAGFAAAVFAFAAGITVLASGKMSDGHIQSKNMVVLGYVIMGGGFLFFTIVDSIEKLMIAQVIVGLGEAIYLPAFDALYSRNLDKEQEASEWGAWEAINYFTAGIGAIIGGIVVHGLGFDAMFMTMAAVSILSALYLYWLPKKALKK